MRELPSFEKFNESIKVTDINEGVFHRLPKNVISDELYLASKNLSNFYDRTAAGNDVDPGVIDTVIRNLDKVKKAVKKFNSKEEVSGTVYESEEVNEGDKVVLGDGKLTPIKRGDKLKFTDKAKEDKGGQMGRLDKKYLDDTLEFEYMAGSALHVKTSDGNTFIIDPSRFIKESEEVNEASVQVAGHGKPSGAKVLAKVIFDLLNDDKDMNLNPNRNKRQDPQLIDKIAKLIMDSTF